MPSRTIFWSLAALAVLAAAWQAWDLRWTCDDAYISFRYAQHFVQGHGLVFNLDPAEPPVEGYSNFSWTMWLAIGWLLGCTDGALETWSNVWGVLCHAGTVLLLAAIAWRASGGRAVVPIAACGYAAIHHAASLAPAGLETALFVLLVTALLRFALQLRCARQAWLMGFLAVLAAMTRPDGALFVAIAGLFVAWDARQRRAPMLLVGYLAPFVLVFVPYLLWRHSYYGYWLPNTYYAKAGGGPLLELGGIYVWEFAKCYHALVVPVLLLLWFLPRRPDLLAPISPWLGRRPWFASAAFVLSYSALVVWVGGDFMFARFLLPVLPALLLALDVACVRWRPMWLQPAFAVVMVSGLLLRVEPPWLGDYELPVSDNRVITVTHMFPEENGGLPAAEAFRRAGNGLRTLFDGLDVRLAIEGGRANLAFRSRAPVAIECAAGLTDAYLAHLPGKHRVKVAHNLDPSHYTGYLERRGVHFLFGQYQPEDAWREVWLPADTVDWSPITPKPIPARLVVYDRDLMRELRRRAPNMVAVDLEQYLDTYLAALPTKTKEQVRADYAKFRAAWFDHTEDPERQTAFERFLQGR